MSKMMIANHKPLYLSEEEAMALLDLCLVSAVETDTVKERALLKLTDLVRRYISSEAEDAPSGCDCAEAEDRRALEVLAALRGSSARTGASGNGAGAHAGRGLTRRATPNYNRLLALVR